LKIIIPEVTKNPIAKAMGSSYLINKVLSSSYFKITGYRMQRVI